MFSDDPTFFVCGHVNRLNVRIWGSENPHTTREHICDSTKLNVWCVLMHNKQTVSFFFVEKTIIEIIYYDIIHKYQLPQVEKLQPAILHQQDGAPAHQYTHVRRILDTNFPDRWIGRD